MARARQPHPRLGAQLKRWPFSTICASHNLCYEQATLGMRGQISADCRLPPEVAVAGDPSARAADSRLLSQRWASPDFPKLASVSSVSQLSESLWRARPQCLWQSRFGRPFEGGTVATRYGS